MLCVPPMDIDIEPGVVPCDYFEKYPDRGIARLEYLGNQIMTGGPNVWQRRCPTDDSEGLPGSFKGMTPRRLVRDPATQLLTNATARGLMPSHNLRTVGDRRAGEGRTSLPVQFIGNFRSSVYVQPVGSFSFLSSVAMS